MSMLEEFTGELSLDHMATHVPHRFTVPAGVETLRLEFAFTPGHPGVGNIPHQLSMSVYGPDGARGTRHNNADQSPIISREWASPGYLAGPIEAGEWAVEIDVHRILPPGGVSYSIKVFAETDAVDRAATSQALSASGGQKKRGRQWYTGDLHGHTAHSDGDLSPEQYVELARDRGYDFVALTDHNTYSAVPLIRQLAGDSMTVIGGQELTTFHGHALALGIDNWTEWRVKDGATMSGLASALQDEGALYVIAHPKSEGHPFCTGCRWAHADMLPGPARHVEVWNREWSDSPHNEQAVRLFHTWLNAGYRMVATAGTDTHRVPPAGYRMAANRVLAADNTEPEILAGLRLGHCYVSSGPDLSFQGQSGGHTVEMGDVVAPGPLKLSCAWQPGPNGVDIADLDARLVGRSGEIGRWPCSGHQKAEVELAAESGDWFSLELRDRQGGLHALSNPVFVGRVGDDWN